MTYFGMSNIFVFDTNVLISATLIKHSVNSRAIDRAIALGRIAMSAKTLDEFSLVIFRKKFDRYFEDVNERLELLKRIGEHVLFVNPTESIQACQDPKDDMFLELAVASKASAIISGDPHLLVLHPFRNIPVVNVTDFLCMSF